LSHGPGATAERNAYQRTRAEAVKWGKADRPFIETESGVAAGTLPQLRVQARTADAVIESFGVPPRDGDGARPKAKDRRSLRGV